MKKFQYILVSLVFIGLAACQSYDNPINSGIDSRVVKSESKYSVDIDNSNLSTLIYKKNFDPEGNLVEYNEYSSFGTIQSRSIFTYNELESSEEKQKFDETGRISSIDKFLYYFLDDGKVKEKHTLDTSGIVSRKEIFSYDEKGNILKKVIFNNNSEVSTSTDYSYKYGNNGNLIERLTIENGNLGNVQTRDSISYIRQHNKLEIFNYNSKGEIQKVKTIFYNEAGLVSIETERNGIGNILYKYAYRYEFY